jgi:hypothetical protein
MLVNFADLNAIYSMQKLLTEWRKYLTNSLLIEEVNQAREDLKAKIENNPNWLQIIPQSLIKNKALIYDDGTYERPIVLLDTQRGPIAFYRSSGTSTPGLKEEGEWHIFGGFAPHRTQNYVILLKNKKSVDLTNGGDKYLTILSLLLEKAWNKGSIVQKQDMFETAKDNLDKINQEVNEFNKQSLKTSGKEKFLLYNKDNLQAAYINDFLKRNGYFDSSTFKDNFGLYDDLDLVGMKPIKSEKLTQFGVQGKILPALSEVA